MTIKLRDLTKEQFEAWSQKHCRLDIHCDKCPFASADCCPQSSFCWIKRKDEFSDKFLDQTVEIDVPDLLTESQLEELKKIKGSSRSAFIRNSAMLCADYPHLAEAIGALKKGFVYFGNNGYKIKVAPEEANIRYDKNLGLCLYDKSSFYARVDRYGQDWTL